MKIRAGFVSNSSSSSFIVASKHHNVSEAKRLSEFEEVYEDGTVCCMTLVASERGITIKTPKKREMSEEHKAKLFGTKNVDLDDNFEDDI